MHETGPRLLARKCNEYVRERVGIFEWALLNEVVRKSVPMLVSDGWSVGWVCRHELTLFMWHLRLWRFWLDSKALQSHDITHKRSPKNTEKKFNRKSTWDGGAERSGGQERRKKLSSFFRDDYLSYSFSHVSSLLIFPSILCEAELNSEIGINLLRARTFSILTVFDVKNKNETFLDRKLN